jgi:transposase, IS5 family
VATCTRRSNELSTVVIRAARVVAQGRRRVAGERIESATRLVSLHDPDARPIVKGKLGTPVEFAYKAQVVDNEDGLVLDYDLKRGNPADAEQLAPAIQRIANRLGRTPQQATADRGYGEARVERELKQLGVQSVVIPRKGKPGKARQELEHSPGFRELVKWRTGCEGRISHLKPSQEVVVKFGLGDGLLIFVWPARVSYCARVGRWSRFDHMDVWAGSSADPGRPGSLIF